MINKINKGQYEALCESKFWDDDKDFNKMLEQITGITAKRYAGYSYYDSHGNYIGDSNNCSVRDLLNSAYIEIGEVEDE